MNKKNILLISAICTLAGGSVALAHGGGRGLFEKVDQNKDGVVTSQEVEASANTHFSELDANKDGKLTAEERKAGHERRMSEHFEERDQNDDGVLEASELDRMPKEFFARLDTDKSGSLSPAELEVVGARKHGHKSGEKGMRADTDGDGAVSKAEFVAKAKAFMTRLDKNSDGKLTAEEAKAARGHGRGRGHGAECDHGSAKPAAKTK